jgi:outer membrane receptor protein involved in Fe transport
MRENEAGQLVLRHCRYTSMRRIAREDYVRGTYSTASWIAVAAAMAVWSGPAFAQQAPAQPAKPGSVAAASNKTVDVVEIYGDRVPNDPGSYSVISAQTIEDVQANHAAEILNTVPGVNVQMNSGQEMLVAIRSPVLPAGAGQGSFLVLENGVPIRAPAFGNVNELFEVHHETASAIEVVRGPGSVRYGSNAVHGLINIIDPEPGAQTGSEVTASLNTLQRYRGDATTNFSLGGADVWVGASAMHDGGWRDSSGVDQQKLSARAGWRGGDWSNIASFSAVNLNQETAGFVIGHDAYKNLAFSKINPNPEAYRDGWAAHVDDRFQKSFGDGVLTVTPFALTQRMIFIQHFLPDQSTEKNGQDSAGVMTHYEFGPENIRWTVGADVQWAQGSLEEIQTKPTFGAGGTFPKGIHYDYDVDTWMYAVYAELNWEFAKNWRILTGVRQETDRYDYTTHKAPGVYGRYLIAPSRDDSWNLFTPKFGVAYDGIEGVQLYANYARGERAPQASDQYRLQNTQTIDRLPVEKLDSYEAGARGDVAGVHYDVAAYYQKKDNFYFRDSDGRNVPNGKTLAHGIEAAVNGNIADIWGGHIRWNGDVSWSIQKYDFTRTVVALTEVITKGNRIDTAPEWMADAGIGWENQKMSLFLSSEYIGQYFTDAANLHTYHGHWIAHLRGSYNFTDKLQAFAIVRNLTDERYADRADFASGQERYFPGEPINLTVGLRARF